MAERPTNEKNKRSVNNLDNVRENILNTLLIAISITAIVSLSASLYRVIDIGWQNVMYFHVMGYLVICVVTLFRQKISYFFKALTLVSVCFLIGCIATINMGLSGSGFIFLVFSMIFATMFFGMRYGGIFIAASLIVLIATAFGSYKGWILFDYDSGAASVSLSRWISKIFAFALFSTFIAVTLGRLIHYLVDSSSKLKKQAAELQRTNKNLLKKISEIKKTKEDLKNSEEKYRILFESASDAIFLMEDERIVDCNKKTLEMFDCSMDEIIGQTPYRYSTEKQPGGMDSKLAALENINRESSGQSQVFEWKHCRSDGSLFDAEVILTSLYLTKKKYLLAVVRDISQRKLVEAEKMKSEADLLQAQKMEAIGTLSGGIAHDLNNILSGIFGYTQLAETNIHNPEKAKDHIKQVRKGAQRAADLVQQILTFSRQKDSEKHPSKLYLEVKEALKLLRSSIPSSIEIKENLDSRSVTLADPTKIHQVVMNLCTNAYHAMMNTGGILNVSLKDIEISEPKHLGGKTIVSGKYLQLEISDTGYGMDTKTQGKAFDPYFTTKKMGKGTGLGLAIVKAIVDEHHGFIEVNSRHDKGTNFYIYFPIIEQKTRLEQKKDDTVSIFEGNETIMIVDDEEAIRLSFSEILEGYGYRVHLFQNGIDAFKEFKTNPHKYNLIITDMTMPGMTGIELIQSIHGVRKDIPSVLCSGFSELVNEENATKMGVSKYLMKPVLKRDLASTIRELVDTKKLL